MIMMLQAIKVMCLSDSDFKVTDEGLNGELVLYDIYIYIVSVIQFCMYPVDDVQSFDELLSTPRGKTSKVLCYMSPTNIEKVPDWNHAVCNNASGEDRLKHSPSQSKEGVRCSVCHKPINLQNVVRIKMSSFS